MNPFTLVDYLYFDAYTFVTFWMQGYFYLSKRVQVKAMAATSLFSCHKIYDFLNQADLLGAVMQILISRQMLLYVTCKQNTLHLHLYVNFKTTAIIVTDYSIFYSFLCEQINHLFYEIPTKFPRGQGDIFKILFLSSRHRNPKNFNLK